VGSGVGRGGPCADGGGDALFHDRQLPVSFIKADLEGGELAMLRGAKATIVQNRPKLAIATYHRESDYEGITALIAQLVPQYTIKPKGISCHDKPFILHAWVKQ
jgi:hypothetical protein